MTHGKIVVATVQFAESFDPRRNAAVIRRYLARAKTRGADLVHFHEAAMTGYLALAKAPPLSKLDWDAIRAATESVRAETRRLRLWVVLGSAHRLTGAHKPTNCLYLIAPDGTIRDRYDKRFLTDGDLAVYTPGDRFVTFNLNGVRCALLLCFDLRFPELYRKLATMKVRAIFQSFHNGYMNGPGIHEHIMRQTMQAHAGMNAFWVSANNSSGYYSRWPSAFIQPDGAIARSLRRNVAGMMVNLIDARRKFYDPSKPFRAAAIGGKLHTGRLVNDPRQRDRRSL